MNSFALKAALSSLNFVAVDVETANEQYDSLCSLGIVVVEKGVVAEERSYRIRPRVLRLSVINQQIHRLTENDLQHAPEIRDIWPDIRPLFVDCLVAAHNASFDIEVLRRSVQGYGLTFPHVKYLCSLKVAAEAFSGTDKLQVEGSCCVIWHRT